MGGSRLREVVARGGSTVFTVSKNPIRFTRKVISSLASLQGQDTQYTKFCLINQNIKEWLTDLITGLIAIGFSYLFHRLSFVSDTSSSRNYRTSRRE